MDFFRMYVTGGPNFFQRIEPVGVLYKVTFYLSFFSVYWINVGFICPNTLKKKNIPLFVVGQLSLFIIFAGVRYLLEEVIIYQIGGFHNYSERSRAFWYYIFDNSYFSLKIVLFSTFIYLLFVYLKNTQKIHELQLEKQKANLDALKMQLEPHFLFNTLHVFYAELADKQPETAKGIYKLSEFLRYVTYEAQEDYMPLHKELKFIQDYIYFYEKRFEDNFYLTLDITGTVGDQLVPSLCLIHFVENMAKHGILNDPHHPASISIAISASELVVRTRNKIAEVDHYSSKGIGRQNLETRLSLLYDQYTFTHSNDGQIFSAYLKIPLKTYR